VTRVPGAQRWMVGLANVRGQLYPLVDLNLFCGNRATLSSRGTRAIIVNHQDVPMGVLVDEVFGFRRFIATDHDEGAQILEGRLAPFVDGVFRREGEEWPLFSFTQLTDSDELLKVAI
jgi:twitching motility protein PilI